MSSSVINAAGGGASEAASVKAPEDQDFYEVKHTQKGYGAYALKPIKRGTRILAEHPLLRINHRAYFKADVEAAFAKLSPEDQKRYFELHSAHGQNPAHLPQGVDASLPAKERQRIAEEHEARISKEASVASIFRTNCMDITKGAAVFYHNARFNHSCNSNAYFFWNEKIDMETIHAIKDIEAGDEITLCYIDPYQDQARRRWEFQHWGFACDCPACGDISIPDSFASKSADNRYRLNELEEMTSAFRFSPEIMLSNSRMVADMLEMAKLHLVEGFYNHALAKIYRDIGLMCEARNDLKHAAAAISKGSEVVEICCGTDGKEWVEIRDMAVRLDMEATALNGGVTEPKLSSKLSS
ncbi:SET domain-containing protein [Mytilinidion resinicola]|uniref:SET domain-containing protein n=1 Tax=Mytilinidion resinicola TaxID=574789 RepID=A0A6A6Z9F1_9PEZI|nr:SET domain-containing protein [Mytilinidion resinicola]KAF2817660.1 SET domain-containing protein [Mytilinidion resinicola]